LSRKKDLISNEIRICLGCLREKKIGEGRIIGAAGRLSTGDGDGLDQKDETAKAHD
jgi:hypothetical protein